MSIKILHTSDWHLGKQLQKIDFHEDMEMFFDWLTDIIKEKGVDVLLMSGDLFDQANPSQQAMRQYYLFLKRMTPLNCKVILTGGNHDSPAVINAPKELLELLDIKVIGGISKDLSDLFIEFEKENEKVVIAAVPFLRDKDIRQTVAGESYEDKIEQIREGLRNYFLNVNNYYSEKYKDLPYVLMGHLFVQGIEPSESEREIQIGNQASIDATIFGKEPHYVALGHIHKPQKVAETILYSGSPIPMSFSEKMDQKRVVLLDVENINVTSTSIEIPTFRKLITLKGSISEIKEKLSTYSKISILPDLAEIIAIEENENVESISDLENLLSGETQELYPDLVILKGKIEFKNKVKGTSSFLEKGEDIASFQPIDLFQKRLDMDESIEDKSTLLNAFREILETISQSNSTL
jgi:exonuclease SbcD